MVDHLAVSRPKLDRRDRPVRIDRDRNHQAAINVAPARRHAYRFAGFEHKVGLAKLPAFGETWCGREILRVPLGCPGIDPIGDLSNLLVAQTPLVMKRAKARLGLPRGHLPTGRDLLEKTRSLGRVFIRQQ